MADSIDPDTCLGFKRRISEPLHIESTDQSILEEQQHSISLSPEQQFSEIVSAAKEDRETENGFLKKPKTKCSSFDESDPVNVIAQETEEVGTGKELKECEMGFSGNQELGGADKGLTSRLGNELNNFEMGFCGNQELVGANKGSTSRLSVEEVQKPFGVDGWKEGLATSCVTLVGNVSESCLKNKEAEWLVEPVVESIADSVTHVSNIPDFQSKGEVMEGEFDNSSWGFDGSVGAVEIPDTDGKGSFSEGNRKLEETEPRKCAMRIEVIDGIAVIETTPAGEIGNGVGKEKGFMGCSTHSVMNRETDGQKEKRPRRRGKGVKKMLGINGKENAVIHRTEVQNVCTNKGDEAKRAYSRQEMEALRFMNFGAQQKKWIEVYCRLVPSVAREYDGLIDCNTQKHIRINFDPRQQFGKKEKKIPGILGMVAAKGRPNHLKIFVH